MLRSKFTLSYVVLYRKKSHYRHLLKQGLAYMINLARPVHDPYDKEIDSCTNQGDEPQWAHKGEGACTKIQYFSIHTNSLQ